MVYLQLNFILLIRKKNYIINKKNELWGGHVDSVQMLVKFSIFRPHGRRFTYNKIHDKKKHLRPHFITRTLT